MQPCSTFWQRQRSLTPGAPPERPTSAKEMPTSGTSDFCFFFFYTTATSIDFFFLTWSGAVGGKEKGHHVRCCQGTSPKVANRIESHCARLMRLIFASDAHHLIHLIKDMSTRTCISTGSGSLSETIEKLSVSYPFVRQECCQFHILYHLQLNYMLILLL